LAALVSQDDLDLGSLYPPLTTIQKCSLKIAARIADYAYEHGKLHAKLLIIVYSYLKSL
jgi:malate dehydrogenase (oxaloacetate-decarboxylating)(NADP+)